MIGQWEWAILLLLFLGLLVVELMRTRRAIRRAGDTPSGMPSDASAARDAATGPPGSPPAA